MQYRWIQTNDDPRIEEARPYQECPHCGEYKLTVQRGRVRAGFIRRTGVKQLYCHNCKISSGAVIDENA